MKITFHLKKNTSWEEVHNIAFGLLSMALLWVIHYSLGVKSELLDSVTTVAAFLLPSWLVRRVNRRAERVRAEQGERRKAEADELNDLFRGPSAER